MLLNIICDHCIVPWLPSHCWYYHVTVLLEYLNLLCKNYTFYASIWFIALTNHCAKFCQQINVSCQHEWYAVVECIKGLGKLAFFFFFKAQCHATKDLHRECINGLSLQCWFKQGYQTCRFPCQGNWLTVICQWYYCGHWWLHNMGRVSIVYLFLIEGLCQCSHVPFGS